MLVSISAYQHLEFNWVLYIIVPIESLLHKWCSSMKLVLASRPIQRFSEVFEYSDLDPSVSWYSLQCESL